MSKPTVHTNLIAHDKAIEAAGESIAQAMKVPAPLKSIADQVIRAANSVAANLAEGQGRIGRDRAHFWRIAYASAREVDSHLQLIFGIPSPHAHLIKFRMNRTLQRSNVCTFRP